MNLVWFRNDLRVNDNEVLKAACEQSGQVLGVYCFDPAFYADSTWDSSLQIKLPFTKTGAYRAQFIIESVANLRENLAAHGIPLLVFHAAPHAIIPELVEKHKVENIYLQHEWTRDERAQEEKLGHALDKLPGKPKGHRFYEQFLFHPDDMPFASWQQIPRVFTEFRKKLEKECRVRPVVSLNDYKQEMPAIEETTIPSLKTLGLPAVTADSRTAFPWKGGEDAALARVQDYFFITKKLQYYKKTRNGLVGTDYSSKLSAWLANGSISARTIYWEVKRFEKEVVANQDTYWMIFELIWRDFFKYVSLKHGASLFKIGGILEKDYEWKSNPRELEKWTNGETHEPFVNANMKELAATGWMSNRGRQNVASYWSMHKEQDWRIGAAYFEHILVDYDVHSNYGNWMYNSGVGNDPRNRTFNIQLQAKNYDGDGKFQRLWLQDGLF